MSEHITDTAALPEGGNADCGGIDRLTQELEALREEKRRRHMLDYAREGLRSRGLDSGFAQFLVGEDERQTARNIGDFEKHFTGALAGEVARRLPKEAPQDFAQPDVKRVRRGIKKV